MLRTSERVNISPPTIQRSRTQVPRYPYTLLAILVGVSPVTNRTPPMQYVADSADCARSSAPTGVVSAVGASDASPLVADETAADGDTKQAQSETVPEATSMPRFRTEEEFQVFKERIVLASYPRSGNTMVRKLIEEMTGIFTGSDTKPGRGMAEMLRNYGLEGEGECSRRSWVIKSHFPERLGWMRFPVQRGILLVRHPVNAIDSYFNMQLAACHDKSLCDSEYTRFANIWDGHIREEVRIWVDFHQYWLRQPIPLLIVRYEDLLVDRENQLRRMFRFLYRPGPKDAPLSAQHPRTVGLCQADMFSAAERLENAISSEQSGVVYKPRKASVAPDTTHYSQAQLQHISEHTGELLQVFGYISGENPHAIGPMLPHPRIRCINKGVKARIKVNDGLPSRESTPEDPARRGFPWKWELRKIVKLKDKKSGKTTATTLEAPESKS